MTVVGKILYIILQIYLVLLIARMIMSWVLLASRDFQPRGWIAVLFEAVYTVTDPPIRFFDKRIPVLRIGAVGISLDFIIVFILVSIAQSLVIRFM